MTDSPTCEWLIKAHSDSWTTDSSELINHAMSKTWYRQSDMVWIKRCNFLCFHFYVQLVFSVGKSCNSVIFTLIICWSGVPFYTASIYEKHKPRCSFVPFTLYSFTVKLVQSFNNYTSRWDIFGIKLWFLWSDPYQHAFIEPISSAQATGLVEEGDHYKWPFHQRGWPYQRSAQLSNAVEAGAVMN